MKVSNVLAETVIAAALANGFCAGSPLLWAENESLPVSLRTHQAEAIAGKETRPDPSILAATKLSLEWSADSKVHEAAVKTPLVKACSVVDEQGGVDADPSVLQWAERLTITAGLHRQGEANQGGFHQPADDEFKEALLTGLTAWVHSENFESTLGKLLEHAAPFSLTVMLPRTGIDSGTVEELAKMVGLHGRQPGIEMSSWTLDLSFKSPDAPLLVTGASGSERHYYLIPPPQKAACEKS